jgi:pimeloyl-ACP methyl ester carboxylesterase
MPCPRCSSWSEADDRFCTFCGAFLVPRPHPRAEVRSNLVPAALAAAIAALTILGVALVVSKPTAPTANESASPTASDEPAPSADASQPAGIGSPFGTGSSASESPCALGELECVRLVMPRDHADPDPDATMEVRFGLHAADPEERTGTLVIATGGPGSSGIELSATYLATLPRGVVDRYDIVFFEQRGVRRSAEITCEEADLVMPRWSDLATLALADATRAATEWVETCLAEAGVDDPSDLDAYGTFQAAADLDAYLDHIGAGKVMLYGESYGTELVQTYAAHRPERVAGLILDAVVDPTLDAVDASIQRAEAFSDLLDRVLDACEDDPFCVDDFPDTSAAQAWDDLADRLRGGQVELELPGRNGLPFDVSVTFDDLVSTSASLLYSEYDRSLLLRLLAAAARDDLKPLVRFSALLKGLDPETGRLLSPHYESVASFYAIACQDYTADRARGAAQLHREIDRLAGEGARLATIALTDLPCFTGFAGSADGEAHADDASGTYPMLVLTSEADPATPMSWAEAVARRHENAYLIVTSDGGHGSFGWGLPCPDDIVKEFLVFGDLPEESRTECDGHLVDLYRPLPLGGPEAYPDVLEALMAVEEALLTMPDYRFWDGAPRRLGCHHGGWMQMTWQANESFELHDCEVLLGWPLNGSVEFTPELTTTMELELPNGTITYESTEAWDVTVEGTLDGEPIDLSR